MTDDQIAFDNRKDWRAWLQANHADHGSVFVISFKKATGRRSAKRGILEWIVQAKKPETRTKRVLETARLAARNERANQWQPKQ